MKLQWTILALGGSVFVLYGGGNRGGGAYAKVLIMFMIPEQGFSWKDQVIV